MFLLFMLIVGSALIGYGAGSWAIGSGVLFITAGFAIHFGVLTHNMHAHLFSNMQEIFNKIS